MTNSPVTPEIQVSPAPYQVPQAFSLVIFGASGDLTRRKLFPALYALAHDNLLPERFAVFGFARREKSHEAFRAEIRAAVDEFSRLRPARQEIWDRLAQNIYYVPAAFEDAAGYAALGKQLAEVEAQYGTCGNRMYYLATPPASYTTVVAQLGAAKLVSEPWPELSSPDWPCWSRVIVEKPFGHDLATAAALNVEIHKVFHETQVYRIDHYLGKETVQNILTFRFGNSIFEPLWNRRYVDHVQLLVGEDLGVEGRGGYYDTAGAVRDMVQNHMLQLLSLVAMEPPATFDAEAVRDEKVKVLRAIRPMDAARVAEGAVRGQYVRGTAAR